MKVCALLEKRHSRGKQFSIVVVAEGAESRLDKSLQKKRNSILSGHVRLGGVGEILADEVEKRTKFETRVTS